MHKIICLMTLIISMQVAYAQDVQNTTVLNTATQTSTVNSTIIGTAQDWGLTSAEWAHYLKLMQGVNGHWYPQLSPPAVLGLNAENAQEKKHFAELVAREEHDKLAREIEFDSAVHDALLRLYPDEPIIKPFDLSPFNPVHTADKAKNSHALQSGDHLVLFTEPGKSLDLLVMPRLINLIQKNSGVTLDVYCVGNGDDNAIRSWAKSNHIPMDLVAQGRITLNHDNGKLQQTAGDVQLPYLVLARNGQSQAVSIWSLS